jgi:hypothetical protein
VPFSVGLRRRRFSVSETVPERDRSRFRDGGGALVSTTISDEDAVATIGEAVATALILLSVSNMP